MSQSARLVALTLLLAPVAACGGSEAGNTVAAVRDSAGIRIVENAVTAGDTCTVSPTPTLDLGLVEGPEEYQFYRVFDAATLSDGRIAVVNQGSSQIRVYSDDGTFGRAFGGEGGGPGEFRSVFQVWVMAGDTLIVGDYRPWRFSIFTADGEFVRSVLPDPAYVNTPESVTPMEDGTYVISQTCCSFGMEPGEWVEIRHHVLQHAADGSLIDTLAVLPHGRRGWIDIETSFGGSPVFETRSHVAARGDRVLIGRGDERQLEVHTLVAGEPAESAPADPPARAGSAATPTLDLSRPTGFIRWTGPPRAVTPEHIEAFRRTELERWAAYDDPGMRRMGEASVSEDRPIADRFPPHGSITIGVEGDIWVHDYRRPDEDDPGWLVFDHEGRFECRAWLPFENTWDVYEIGADYVIGKMTDELDVEHVVRYPLARPGG